MSTLAFTTLPKDKPQIITERLLNAPRELVFKVLTEADHIKNFWGPDGFTNTIKQMDVKPGGQWLFTMHGPDGRDYTNENVFAEIEAPTKVVIRHDSKPKYCLTITLEPSEEETIVYWDQVFENSKVARSIEHIVVPANEQNLERLSAEVLRQ